VTANPTWQSLTTCAGSSSFPNSDTSGAVWHAHHLDTRLAQSRAGDLGHLEFLQVLCEDEISRRQTTGIARRLRRARFGEQATFEGFDFTANPKLPAAQIRDLAALRWLISGRTSSGRSMILTSNRKPADWYPWGIT
jgi:DNA replication protein DnaC